MWVESPLQLLGTVEAHALGALGTRSVVTMRAGVGGLSDRMLAGLDLPPGLEIVAEPATVPPRRADTGVWAAGDVYSGQVQTALVRSRGQGTVVLLDDGLATLRAFDQLAAARATPLERAGVRSSPHRALLGGLAWRRLRALARADRLAVVTALPVPQPTHAALAAAGVRVVRHRFGWLAAQPVQEEIDTDVVVVGSALAADGFVDAGAYVRWVESHARLGTVGYLPHRRSDPAHLARLAAHPRVRVLAGDAPVEVRLRGLRSDQEVRCLPSTAWVTLRLLFAGTGPEVTAAAVPDVWWTEQAPRALREVVARALDAVAAAP